MIQNFHRRTIVPALALSFLIAADYCAVKALNPAPAPRASRSDFYVSTSGSDSNEGTVKRPWKTISHAAASLKPGATVHVTPGEYRENVITSVRGTSSARIRYISDQQGAAHLIGAAGDATWKNKADYVDIMGFDVTGSAPVGIHNLASFVRILGNTVHDIVAGCDSNGGAGIDDEGPSRSDNDDGFNVIYNVRQPSGCPQRHGVGIYHANPHGRVYNNLVMQCGAEGIQLWHAANAVIVANNTVVDTDDTGILIGAGDSPGGITNDNSIVINNIVANNRRYGILEYGTTGPHNSYLNNIVFGNSIANLQLITGIASGTIIADPQLVNNTGTVSGNYHLGAKSPGIDVGVTANAPTSDIVGGTRPQGKAIDIGAYETGAAPGKWPWI